MTLRSIILLILLSMPCVIIAHEDSWGFFDYKNLNIQYSTISHDLELSRKVDIFIQLAGQLIESKGYQDIPFYIYFKHNYTKTRDNYTRLDFGKYDLDDFGELKRQNKKRLEPKIVLEVHDTDFYIGEMLNLLNNSFGNASFIQKNNNYKLVRHNRHLIDTLYSIEENIIEKYKNEKDELVENLLKERTFIRKPYKKRHDVDYFFQNNQYHFYDSDVFERTEDDSVYLVLDELFEIIGDHNNTFIFTNDSMFYYANYIKEVQGPFTINNLMNGRPPIAKYLHERSFYDKHYLIFYNYSGNSEKALFLAGEGMVISNYEKAETALIEDFIEKDNKFNVFFIGLIISILLSFWWWRSRKN